MRTDFSSLISVERYRGSGIFEIRSLSSLAKILVYSPDSGPITLKPEYPNTTRPIPDTRYLIPGSALPPYSGYCL